MTPTAWLALIRTTPETASGPPLPDRRSAAAAATNASAWGRSESA
ncbi:hypothetical protein [Sphingomonas sp.]